MPDTDPVRSIDDYLDEQETESFPASDPHSDWSGPPIRQVPDATNPPDPPDRRRSRLRGISGQLVLSKVLTRLQILIVLPFTILLVVAVGSYVYGGYLTVRLAFNTSWGSSGVAQNVVRALQIIDVCLIGTAALVIAADALMMFLAKPDTPSADALGLPWWEADTVERLKNRALSMVILIMVVTFLESIVEPHDPHQELDLGISIGIVIIAVGIYLFASRYGRRRQYLR